MFSFTFYFRLTYSSTPGSTGRLHAAGDTLRGASAAAYSQSRHDSLHSRRTQTPDTGQATATDFPMDGRFRCHRYIHWKGKDKSYDTICGVPPALIQYKHSLKPRYIKSRMTKLEKPGKGFRSHLRFLPSYTTLKWRSI